MISFSSTRFATAVILPDLTHQVIFFVIVEEVRKYDRIIYLHKCSNYLLFFLVYVGPMLAVATIHTCTPYSFSNADVKFWLYFFHEKFFFDQRAYG
jgi:hypothetical protein